MTLGVIEVSSPLLYPACFSGVYVDQIGFKLIDSQHEHQHELLIGFLAGILTLAAEPAAEDGAAAPAADAPTDGKDTKHHTVLFYITAQLPNTLQAMTASHWVNQEQMDS